MMKKTILAAFLAVLVFLCTACTKEDAQPIIARSNLYVYNVFMDNTPESAIFTVRGTVLPIAPESGAFSGLITVEEADGTVHLYENLQYCWTDGILLLHRGDPTATKSDGVLCWFDPFAPKTTVLADRAWCPRNAETEVVVYLDKDLSDLQGRALGTKINQQPGVICAEYVSRDEVFSEFADQFDTSDALTGVDPSGLGARYILTVKTSDIEAVMSQVSALSGVSRVHATQWAPESIRILGPTADGTEMQKQLQSLPVPWPIPVG